ncbi:MAG: 30S ribosomal protein S12 methylthiotransferase RimO [Pseudomonadota bacterium]|nr:30S ribosomal protein S12 methylthiotransferase RimO [Pseudomonadota bacterium]
MITNSKSTRPDVSRPRLKDNYGTNGVPQIGMISLGCPKALVDSEKLLSKLQSKGYQITNKISSANAVIINTCGFLDSAKIESLNNIGEALRENGKVIVTGCLGAKPEEIIAKYPSIESISGPQQFEKVIEAVERIAPIVDDRFLSLIPNQVCKLTPPHYSYLKISEGCNHKCGFCIIPSMRGKLSSRSGEEILREAEYLCNSGVRELLIISQDTSAYGFDFKNRNTKKDGEQIINESIVDLSRALGKLNAWVRLHYVYPYPTVRKLVPLMADGLILPYLDIPFQHSHPDVLKRMSRPANQAKTLNEINYWREICPEITIRSTFIVGYPGETEEEFNHLLSWLEEAQLDRVGCFKYENVEGARSNFLPNHCSEEQKKERWEKFMETAQRISSGKLRKKIGSIQEVIVDEVDDRGAICRTMGDAPEIDGNLFIDRNFSKLAPGDIISVKVDESSEYDLWGVPC